MDSSTISNSSIFNGYNMANNSNLNVEMISNGTTPTEIATSVGAAIMLFSFILGVIGNLWILLAICLKNPICSIINVFIISLIINDFLTYFMVVVFIIDSYVAHQWNAGEVMCKLNPELTVLFTGCSLWHTALIAIHRYIVVCHNAVYKRMSKAAYISFVLIAARAVPAICIFPGFSLQTSIYHPKLLRCILGPDQKIRIIIITMIQIVVPCIIVVLCYALVFAFVHRISRHIQQNLFILKREIQITKMFGMVFLMIMLGFIPYAIIRNADHNNHFSADVYVVATTVYAIATCSNPLVYGAMSTDIRRICLAALKDLLRCLHIGSCLTCVKFDPVNTINDPSNMVENNIVTDSNIRTRGKTKTESVAQNKEDYNGTTVQSHWQSECTTKTRDNGVNDNVNVLVENVDNQLEIQEERVL